MSCMCENMKYARELERIRRLAKNMAELDEETVVIFMKDDGSYDFMPVNSEGIVNKTIVEYVTQY